MTQPSPTSPDRVRIASAADAAVTAYDSLRAAGHSVIEVDTPHQTRGTWIVPAETDEGPCRVHIDPRTGQTRVATAAP